MDYFQGEDSVTFTLGLIDTDPETGEQTPINCPSATINNCRLVMTRSMTPILSYMNPRVLYDGAELSFYLDPKAAQGYKTTTELYFTEVRINGQTVDFQDYVDTDTTINAWTRNQVKGVAKDSLPTAHASVNFKFKAGDSLHDETLTNVCSIDGSTCYEAKVVPVIKAISK